MGKKSGDKPSENGSKKTSRKDTVEKPTSGKFIRGFKSWCKENGWKSKNGILYQGSQNNSKSHTFSDVLRMFYNRKDNSEWVKK